MLDSSKPLLEHLEELRSRLIKVLITVVVAFLLSYNFVDRIIQLMTPLTGGFVFLRPTEVFLVRLKIAFAVGCFASVPVIIYHLWRFIGVALTPAERRATLGLLPVSYGLFTAGISVAWFIVMPVATKFLMSYATPDLKPLISIDRFVSFTGWFLAGFGIMFQLPLVVYFLVKFGWMTAQSLSGIRPYVYVGLAFVAAALTPGPDVFSQLALLLPTILLYEISILMARFMKPREERSARFLPPVDS